MIPPLRIAPAKFCFHCPPTASTTYKKTDPVNAPPIVPATLLKLFRTIAPTLASAMNNSVINK